MAHSDSHAASAHGHDHGSDAGPHHGPSHYVRIWVVLCVLLGVSIVGPMFGVKLLTLITAFGIAIVKAWMVASYFMHLNIEKKFATFVLVAMIGALLVFWYGIAPDVMKHEGVNWENRASQEHIRHQLELQAAAPGGHGEAPHDDLGGKDMKKGEGHEAPAPGGGDGH
jgi:caa(3)-type oxidase subunit IV